MDSRRGLSRGGGRRRRRGAALHVERGPPPEPRALVVPHCAWACGLPPPPPPPRDVDRSFIIFIIIAPINHNHHDTQGRTHTAHHVGGGVLLCFGGGASLSNRVGLLDTASWTFSEPRLLRPQHTGNSDSSSPPGGGALVRPRVSHVAVLAGTRLLVHGGWCRRELNDLLALDLVPGPSGGPGGAATTGARAGGMG